MYFNINDFKYKIDSNSIKDMPLIKDINNLKLLIISFDNRKNLEYLTLHNKNISNYCAKYNIDYKFIDSCDKNVYWCKLYLIYNELINNKYDYIMWMDTDTIFVNQNINLLEILYNFPSDIYIGHDYYGDKYDYYGINNILCAGVFIIKNSDIGKKFINECLETNKNLYCINNSSLKLNGLYAALCYEQGTMNNLIYNKYLHYTSIFLNNLISNSYNCNNNTFITHYFGGNKEEIVSCFNKFL
jgi:hypothetical protein